jgi:hypothetical protein
VLFSNKIMTTVYALTNPSFPEIKIGFSSNIQQRLGILNSSVPNRFSVYFSRTFPSATIARQVESRVHERFKEYRASNGEFFRIDPKEAALELYHIGNSVMSQERYLS